MSKSSFSIIFITQNGKLKSDGTAPIIARITLNGEMCHFSTRLTILPDRWLNKEYRTLGKTKEEKSINEMLEHLKVTIKERYLGYLSRGETVTASKLKNSIVSLDENSKTLMELCDLFIADYEKLTASRGYGMESLMRYRLAKTRMQEYLVDEYKVKDIALADINKRFLDRFYLWLCTKKKQSNNTATKFIYRCSSIYRVAFDNGWVKANPFNTLKLHLDKVDRGYLTKAELARLIQKEFSTRRLELVRDIFVFSCYTGLAYIDVARLTPEMITEWQDGNLWIQTHRQKTKIAVNVLLLDVPKMIIEKYRGEARSGKLLPILSNQKMNSYLKEIAGVCEIDKELSFHMARHTFATTITLSNGVPIETVSKMLGHSNIRTTQIYARITDQKVSNDMAILADKLNGLTQLAASI